MNMDVRDLCRSDSIKIAAIKIMMYKLLLVGVQEVRWDKDGTEPVVIHLYMKN
jgi:hypothetical protein